MGQETVLFLGRFHPLVLHLPIGFLLIGFVLELLSRKARFVSYRPVVGFALVLGAVSAFVAAALGYMLAQGGGYNAQLLFIHQWGGIALVVMASTACMLYRLWQRRNVVVLKRAYTAAMVLSVVLLSVAGHYGGSLTHGSDYLTRYMPDPLRRVAGLPSKASDETPKITNLDEARVFEQIIYPIFDAKCNSCHNPDKSKGDLMLHTPEAIMKGGEGGPVLVAGNASESELIKRIHLPEIHDDHMPPKGKSQLTADEADLLAWWIDEHAPFDKTVADLNVNAEIQSVLNTLMDPNVNKTEVDLLLEGEIKPADKAVLAKLESGAVKLRPVAQEKNWLQAKVRGVAFSDSTIVTLTPLVDQLTWLDLGNTPATDHVFPVIAQFKNLTRLHLQNTEITDSGLLLLTGLRYLEYLNLHGTNITDEGIRHLAGLKNLRKLFVWQTGVTPEGARALKAELPALTISLGMEGANASSIVLHE